MSAIDYVMEVLAADPEVIEIAGSRHFPYELPQTIHQPAIVYQQANEVDGRHLGGSNRYPLARIIVDAVGSTYGDADALGALIKARLIDYRGGVSGAHIDDIAHADIDFFDKGEHGDRWRRRLAFDVRYRETG